MSVLRFRCLLLALLAVFAHAAYASEGLNLLATDALALGRAGSGVASPRSAYWSILNPAALTDFCEPRFDTTLYVVSEKIRLKPHGLLANPFDGELNADNIIGFPTGGAVYPVQDGRGAIGGGFYVVGGGAVKYDNSRTWLGKLFYGNQDRRNELQHARLVFSYGYELGDGWSIGVGVQGSMTRLRTDQLTLSLRPARNDDNWDTSYGIGFNLGIYKTIGEHFALGAMYKTPQWAGPLHGYRDLAPKSLEFPQMVQAGIAWIPIPERLTFTLDYEFQQWSAVPPFGQPVLRSGLGWNDINALKAGVEWVAIPKRLTLMAGVSVGRPVVDHDHVFVNSFIPTLIEQHYTAGLAWQFDDHNTIQLIYLRSAQNTLKQSLHGDILDTLGGAGSELTVAGNSIAIGFSHKF